MRRPSLLVQVVNVLRHHRHIVVTLQFFYQFVPLVRLRRVQLLAQPVVKLCHEVGVCDPCLVCRHALYGVVFPQSVVATKRLKTALHRHAGASEEHYFLPFLIVFSHDAILLCLLHGARSVARTLRHAIRPLSAESTLQTYETYINICKNNLFYKTTLQHSGKNNYFCTRICSAAPMADGKAQADDNVNVVRHLAQRAVAGVTTAPTRAADRA